MSRQLPALNLTEKQAKWVAYVAQGVPKTKAAELAGYTDPTHEPFRLLQLPHVLAALKHESAKLINSELLPLAIGRLKGVLLNPLTADQHVIKASVEVIKASGVHKGAGAEGEDLGKALSGMGRNELEDLVDRLRTAVSAHEAKTIDAVPDSVTVVDDELEKLLD